MTTWIRASVAGMALIGPAWVALFVVARRLPRGVARDLLGLLPDCATLMWRLRRNPGVSRRAKMAIAFAAAWVASPIDLIPEFLPVIGPLDDVIVVAIALRYAGRQVPRETILGAWPGNPKVIEKLLGRRDVAR